MNTHKGVMARMLAEVRALADDLHRYAEPDAPYVRRDGPGEPDRTPRSRRGAARADRRARRGHAR